MSDANPRYTLATRAVHHPHVGPPSRPVSTPIYQTSTYQPPDAAASARDALQVQPTAFYTRYGNPTIEVWERVMADLEGGEKCLAFATGMAAVSTVLLASLNPGDHALAGSSLYTATTKLFAEELPRLGVAVDFVDPTDTAAFARAARPNTRLFYLESPSNPLLRLTDLAAVCRIAKERRIVTVVDNTFATPCNQQPLALGADLVIHSATKYIGGHSDVLGGCVITDARRAEQLWFKRTLLGGTLDPFAAWLLLRGVKTMALRVQRQNENALAIARALQSHPAVVQVLYPGLESHPQHELARRQMRGFGGMLSFEVRGGRAAGQRVAQSTQLALLAVSLGGVETLIEHAASMSHSLLNDDQLQTAGIPPGLIRLSVGIEDPADLIADLRQALER